jgi:Outer membrane protein beta-barrel domain
MNLPSPARTGALVGLAVALSLVGPARADDWTETTGGLGHEATRFALHIGGSWGPVNGTEVEKVDPASGFEVGLSARVLWSISLYGSYASTSGNVSGQLVQLLDQRVRADGRSGNVDGSLDFRRYRAGLRIDGLRQKNWPFQAYFVGAAVFTTNEIKLDSVDHAPPVPIALPQGGSVDLRKFDDSQTGFLGRVGVEYPLVPHAWVYVNFTYEVLEPPPGTNATTSFNGGLTLRI